MLSALTRCSRISNNIFSISHITTIVCVNDARAFHGTANVCIERRHRRDTAAERRQNSVDLDFYEQQVKNHQSRNSNKRREVRASFRDGGGSLRKLNQVAEKIWEERQSDKRQGRKKRNEKSKSPSQGRDNFQRDKNQGNRGDGSGQKNNREERSSHSKASFRNSNKEGGKKYDSVGDNGRRRKSERSEKRGNHLRTTKIVDGEWKVSTPGRDKKHRAPPKNGENRATRRAKQFGGRAANHHADASLDGENIENDEVSKPQENKQQAVTVKTKPPSQFPPHQLDVYVACHPGLETFLSEELTNLGIGHKMKGHGAVLHSPTKITLDDVLQCHLYLGTASNVFLRLGEPVRARALGELRRRAELIPWRKILSLPDIDDGSSSPPQFKFKVTSAKSRLLHSTAIRDHVLEGIFTSLGYQDPKAQKDAHNAKEIKEDADDLIRLTVQVFRDKAQISIDTSDTPLHQRNYRFATAKAPLREDLAYAFLASAGWKPLYTLKGEEKTLEKSTYTSFLDPFCGSGTIAIEAAAMASGLPPGRLRPAPLKGTCLYDPEKWEILVKNALEKSAALDKSMLKISASDRSKGGVTATKTNAERAGVLALIETENCAFTAHPWLGKQSETPENLLLAANLPFGRRLQLSAKSKEDSKHPLLPLYQSLANIVNKLFSHNGSRLGAILLTDERKLVRMGGFDREFEVSLNTKHGGIPVSGMVMNGER